jgi:hypothetical protein
MLAVDDRDAGCGATRMVLDRYVEAELGVGDPGAGFTGVAVHLTVCPACRAEHDGLLALIDHDVSPDAATPGACAAAHRASAARRP